MNRSRSWTKNSCFLVYLHIWAWISLAQHVHWSKHTIFCVSGTFSWNVALSSASSLYILSPTSTLPCSHNLLVVNFPQVFLPQNWTLLSFPNFSLVPSASWRFHGVSRRSVQSLFSSFPQNRIHWIWVLRYTTWDLFFLRIATAPWVPSFLDLALGFFSPSTCRNRQRWP